MPAENKQHERVKFVYLVFLLYFLYRKSCANGNKVMMMSNERINLTHLVVDLLVCKIFSFSHADVFIGRNGTVCLNSSLLGAI